MNFSDSPSPESNPSTHATLSNKGLAAMAFDVRWQDGDVSHADHLYFEKFNAWRDIDYLPSALAQAATQIPVGARVESPHPAGELLPPWTAAEVLSLPRHAFDCRYLHGRELTPTVGRFYPRGVFHGHGGMLREEWLPVRITALTETAMTVDRNPPLTQFPVTVGMTLSAILEGTDMRGGRCNNCIDDLLRGPGFMVLPSPHQKVDFGLDATPLDRPDATPDSGFYSLPRLVQHLDAWCLHEVAALYAHLLPAGAKVLDLMGSFDSHLDAAAPAEVSVLGMNTTELDANPCATERVLQDLNLNARLPFADVSFDAVVCTASVEYLTDPLAVFAEVKRILKPGGVFINTFSNRWFPTKAIRLWSDMHEFERVAWVTEAYRRAGFGELNTLSKRNWPRPKDDAYAATQRFADPLYAVWGRRM